MKEKITEVNKMKTLEERLKLLINISLRLLKDSKTSSRWSLELSLLSLTRFKMLSIKFGKTLKSALTILKSEWRICSRWFQKPLEEELNKNSRKMMCG